jgi:tripartite-type tricarboxylate transporter receptor subunit TctC
MSTERLPKLPDIPTMAEAGYPTVLGGLCFGISGPAGLPKGVVERLTAEITKISIDRTFQGELESLGVIVTPLSGDAYVKFIQDEISKYGKIAREAGISID